MSEPSPIVQIIKKAAFLVLPFFLGGCLGIFPSPFRPSHGPVMPPQTCDLAEAFDVVCRNYRLGPEDTLQVNFQTDWGLPAGSYKLDTLDVVDVEFILDPELNRKVIIRPDGIITLPGIGDINAAGQSPEELARTIEHKFRQAKIFKNGDSEPRGKNYKLVTVSVAGFQEKVKKLVDSVTTLTNGQQTQLSVKPDGTIDLPLLKERIIAAGYTIPEVERTINRLYRNGPLKHVLASVSLGSANSRKVYVLGEVRKPGAYDIKQPITAVHAIALAGGHDTETANLKSVILVSKDIHGKPIGRRLDVKRLFDCGDMSSAILVKPYDVIYVPRSYIFDVPRFMDHYCATAGQAGGFAGTLMHAGGGQGGLAPAPPQAIQPMIPLI